MGGLTAVPLFVHDSDGEAQPLDVVLGRVGVAA